MRSPGTLATVASGPAHLPSRGGRYVGLTAAVVMHVALFAAVLTYAPVRHSLAKAAPMIVSLIPPEPAPPPQPPKPLPPRPTVKPALPRAIEPLPVPEFVDAPAPQLAAIVLAAPVVAPPARVEEAPPVAVAAVAAPDIVPPRFDAAYLDNPAPAYPPLARRAGEQGRVLLRVHVTASGVADNVEVRQSSGSPRLDEAARETVRRWRFAPAQQGERAVAAWVIVPITFTLDRSRPA